MKIKLSIVTGLLILLLGSVTCQLREIPRETTALPKESAAPQTPPPSAQEKAVAIPAAPLSPAEKKDVPTYSVAEVVALVEAVVVRVETSEGSGSGIIITRSGYVLTNQHVVEGATLLKITVKSGDKYDGIVVATDDERDLAIVGIIADRSDFPGGKLGSSENVTIGEEVVALGYALGLEGRVTVSKGIVSAIRDIDGKKYIQTDVPINPGNSGGPLVNLRGEIIGINAAKYVGTSIEGIGLAIPIDGVKPFIEKSIGG